MKLKELITALIVLSDEHGPDTEVDVAYADPEIGWTLSESALTVSFVAEHVRIAGELEELER